MASTRILTRLFRAVAAGDLERATSVARQICEEEERKGHHTAARTLRGALLSTASAGRERGEASKTTSQTGSAFLSSALVRLTSDVSLSSVELSRANRLSLSSLIAEWRNQEQLFQHNLRPRSKLLFHGPPGCGKSLTARALAFELGLPAFLVRFDSIIGAYLGQTAVHLRQLFAFAESTPCILLLDELDALGKRRGNPLDVGELDRIVIALLQELEHSHPPGLIIATSNLAANLDDAIWRRFDLELTFAAPSRTALLRFAKIIASRYTISLPLTTVNQIKRLRSFADAEACVMAEARRQILAQ